MSARYLSKRPRTVSGSEPGGCIGMSAIPWLVFCCGPADEVSIIATRVNKVRSSHVLSMSGGGGGGGAAGPVRLAHKSCSAADLHVLVASSMKACSMLAAPCLPLIRTSSVGKAKD